MKKGAFILLVVFSIAYAKAQEKGSEIGFHLSEYQNDFGLGLNFTSPYLIKSYVAITLRSNLMFHQFVDQQKTVWEPYYNAQIGVIGYKSEITQGIIAYGEGGIVGLVPSSKLSKASFGIGGYGLFGFQFNFDNYNAYFIELGGMGNGIHADKLPTEPIFSNGFIINVGYKIIFTKN